MKEKINKLEKELVLLRAIQLCRHKYAVTWQDSYWYDVKVTKCTICNYEKNREYY